MSDQIFDCKQGVGTCVACGKNFECGAFVSNPKPYSWVQERFMSKQEVYHSSTLGPIPLSFTGRRLMQNLREAFQEMLNKHCKAIAEGRIETGLWDRVSRARGELAQYMSRLEKRFENSAKAATDQQLIDELQLRDYSAVHKSQIINLTEPLSFTPHKDNGYPYGRSAAHTMQFFGRSKRAALVKNEYFVRVIEPEGWEAASKMKRVESHPGSIITTEVQLSGSMQVIAFTSDDALDMAVAEAYKHGFTELTKKNFEVRYLGPAEVL